MPFICEICNNGSNQQEKTNNEKLTLAAAKFENASKLRSHLVENHAKFVAHALLAPKIYDKTHFWLLANVDYSSSAASTSYDGEIMDECFTSDETAQQKQLHRNAEFNEKINNNDQFLTEDNDNVEEKISENISANSLEMLLRSILDSANGQNANNSIATTTTTSKGEQDDEQLSTSKAPIKMVMENSNNDELLEFADKQLDLFDSFKSLLSSATTESGLQQKSGESTPSRAALIDSKAIRKAHCQVCNLDICSTARQRHVYMVHLKKKDLFKCQHCDYTNSNSMWEVAKHSRMQHGLDSKPTTQEEKHKIEIQMWSQLCFPEWKQKPQKRKLEEQQEAATTSRETVKTTVFDANEWTHQPIINNRNNEKMRQEEKGLNVSETDYIETKFADEEDETREEACESGINKDMTTEDGMDMNDRLCHLCMEESKYPGRHIAQRHLKKALYECPICHKFGSYESCTVNKHILKVHPEEASKVSPINNLEKYADEIRELQTRCFPNRQMKLVRPVTSSNRNRPRERHQCGICGMDVAQSDRQRHVFHKHLRKGKIFECPLCEFSSNYDIHRVKWHIKWDHKNFADTTIFEPISHEPKFREEIDALNEKCFPGWQRKRHISIQEERKMEEFVENTNCTDEVEQAEAECTPFTLGCIETDRDEESGVDMEMLMERALRTVAEAIHRQQQKKEQQEESASPEINVNPTVSINISDEANGIHEWICQLCQIALKPGTNLLRHVTKDHLNLPLYQCPVCVNHGAHSAYEVRSHMARTHGLSEQEPLSSLEKNMAEIKRIWCECFPHKEFKANNIDKMQEMVNNTSNFNNDIIRNAGIIDETRVRCRECGQDMKTEDRQIHVYRHHLREPRLYECPVCDFSHYACSSDVRNHINRAHKNQPNLIPRTNLLRYSKEIAEWNERCFPGWINRRLPASLIEDFNSCRLCGMDVRQTSRHIAEHHLKIPLHQCPLCEYGAAEARLVQRHMRNNHTLKECEKLEPIANVEKRRGEFSELHNQCFPGRPKRLSNITIADESRRAKCRGCGMTISKKRRLLHILERHLRKPVYKCKYCLFSSTHDRSAVEAHQKEKHASKAMNTISNLFRHKGELKRLALECFNEPNLKLSE